MGRTRRPKIQDDDLALEIGGTHRFALHVFERPLRGNLGLPRQHLAHFESEANRPDSEGNSDGFHVFHL
jgi:hypothetical protein